MLPFRATRLAPSPTGALHLGHARTFLITWWLARQANAKIYLRMEDLDAGRAKPESIQQAYDDLHWLGIDWDPYEETQNSTLEPQNTVTQSHRLPLYHAALKQLWQKRAIYPCTCTRADIAAAVANSASAPHEGEPQPRYPNTCRDRFNTALPLPEALATIHATTGKPPCLRLRVPDRTVHFTDLIAGPHSLNIHQDAGDFPLTRFLQPAPAVSQPPNIDHSKINSAFSIHNSSFSLPPAYQLACVTDDHAMAIDLVIRGDDLLPSTPRQLLLYEALGITPPRFAHVPLVIGPDGKRLAKRHGESRIAQFRSAGLPPEKIIGWAAWRSGQLDTPREISARDMLKTFDLGKLPHDRVVLTPQDFDFLLLPSH